MPKFLIEFNLNECPENLQLENSIKYIEEYLTDEVSFSISILEHITDEDLEQFKYYKQKEENELDQIADRISYITAKSKGPRP